MEQSALKNVNNCLNTNIYSYLEMSGCQSSNLYYLYLNVIHFSTPVIIRHLWQLKTVVFLLWCLIHAVLLGLTILRELALGPDKQVEVVRWQHLVGGLKNRSGSKSTFVSDRGMKATFIHRWQVRFHFKSMVWVNPGNSAIKLFISVIDFIFQ